MIKILVVEDERPISDLIRMNLEDAGYQCACALDGLTAADILEKHTFDLVLLDIMLPKVARIQVVLRRYHKDATKLVFGDIVLNTENRTVCRNGQEIVLTPKEFTLLELFVRNKNMTLFRDKIYELVWENDSYGDTRTLDLHVQRLRKKLGLTEKLKTIYKVGYRLED